MESSLGANVSAFVDIENDLLNCCDGLMSAPDAIHHS
jgi:hypothetical protein